MKCDGDLVYLSLAIHRFVEPFSQKRGVFLYVVERSLSVKLV